MLVVNDSLHVVASNSLTTFNEKPGVSVGLGQLRLPACFKPIKVGLGAQALDHERCNCLTAIAAICSAAIAMAVASMLGSILGFRRIIVFKRPTVVLDLVVHLCDLFGEPLAT
jgi:hypothetical protein